MIFCKTDWASFLEMAFFATAFRVALSATVFIVFFFRVLALLVFLDVGFKRVSC